MANNPQYSAQPRPRPVRRRQSPTRMMAYGASLIVLGIILTIVAQVISTSLGASVTVVFYGLILVGVIYTIMGFFRWVTKR